MGWRVAGGLGTSARGLEQQRTNEQAARKRGASPPAGLVSEGSDRRAPLRRRDAGGI